MVVMASLCGYDADKILKAVRKKAQELAIDFSKFDSGKTSNELRESGQDYYHMYFYNRLEEYTGYTTSINVLPEFKEEFVQAIKAFNKILDDYARQVAIDVIGEDGDKDFFAFNSANSTYGYCHLSIIENTKEKEEERRLENERRWIEEEENDDNYYETECTNCGDGGCIHCEPDMFL